MKRVIVVGLGPIGIAVARAVTDEHDMRLVGLVDADPAKIGRRLDDLDDRGDQDPAASGDDLRIAPNIAAAVAAADGADVAIVTTTSKFDRLCPTLTELMARRVHVVSSCEEMVWPWYSHAELARQIDAQARAAGVALLGSGVNPGFVMDHLAVVLSSMLRRVTGVRCIRRVNAALRRVPLQAKVGATMKVEDFAALARAGKIGHKGLPESVALLAAGLGRQVAPGSVNVTLDPVIATEPTPSALGLIEPGRVAGIHNVGLWTGPDLTLELDLTMAVGLPDPKDKIIIQGPVPVHMKIAGGLPGDSATVAAMVNCARGLDALAPGLRTMLDMPPAGACGKD